MGAGFGGLAAARALSGRNVAVTLIDRTNHHVFQPLLYQVRPRRWRLLTSRLPPARSWRVMAT
nr:NAD(P)-binding protein [Sphingomonas sp. Ant20]